MNEGEITLTPEQEKEVAALVAQGWSRDAAVMVVLETTPDVLDE